MSMFKEVDVMPEEFDRVGWKQDVLRGWMFTAADGAVLLQHGSNLVVGIERGEPGVVIGREYEAAAMGEAMRRFALHDAFQPPTSVWNVSKMPPADIERLGIVYVGRKVKHRDALGNGAIRFDDHVLGNPYHLKRNANEQDRRECVGLYRDSLRRQPELIAIARSLRGKRLGCWCGTWDGVGRPTLLCHAVEIALLAEEPLRA